jgi:GWxTD domain-containing protein
MLALILIQVMPFEVECYRFGQNQVECWYEIDLAAIRATAEKDTAFKGYSYRFVVRSVTNQDSIVREGRKGISITGVRADNYILDYVPLHLFPGAFTYKLELITGDSMASKEGTIMLEPDTIRFTASDVILSRKNLEGPMSEHGSHEFIPMVLPEYTFADILVSYMEIYGLVPDSLFYEVNCQIIDSDGRPVYRKSVKRIKYDYNQVDTLSISLQNLNNGDFELGLTISDPAQDQKLYRSASFKVRSGPDSLVLKNMKYSHEIQYLVSSGEYKKFCKLDEKRKASYLVKFWLKNDYRLFEQRLLQADEKFSTSIVKGRDSSRGRFYLMKGPPDEIESMPLLNWARPLELWYYYAQGFSALFCDRKQDDNPLLVKIIKGGENFDEESILRDIAPGTFNAERTPEDEEWDKVR